MELSAMSREELTRLYETHLNMVYRLCFTYMKNRADAEDAVQNTFIKLMRSGKQFKSAEHEKAWLVVTASNTCRDALRRACRKDEPLDSCRNLSVPVPDEEAAAVLEAVLSLPEKHRDTVYLYYYEGYSCEEVGRLLGRPSSTVRNQLHAARKKLKKLLGGDFYEG